MGSCDDFLRRVAPFQRQAGDEIHGALAFAQFGHFLAADERGELFVELAGSDAVGPGAVAVGLDAELRDGGSLVELAILEAGDGFGDASGFRCRASRSFSRSGPKIFTATGAETPLSMWPMRSASGPLTTAKMPGTDFSFLERSSRISFAIPAVLPSSIAEIHIELGGGNRDHVVAALGPAETAADLAHLPATQDLLLDHIGDLVHLLQRGAGRGGGGDKRGLLLEAWQEILAHLRIERECGDDDEERDGQ